MTGEEPAIVGPPPAEGVRGIFEGPGAMRARCRALDWRGTALGDPADWPASLRTTAESVLATAFPAIVLWGPALVQLYNDAYVPFLGVKHPAALGQPTRECWPEVWHINAPIYARVRAGETVFLQDAHFPVLRRDDRGRVDDLYLTLSYSPVRDEQGAVDGVSIVIVDTTAQVRAQAAVDDRQQLEARLHGVLLETALVLDQVRDAYLVMDADLRVASLNQSAERALARPREALVGRTHQEAFPASLDAEPERHFRRVIAEGVEAHFVHRYSGDGPDVHLEIDAYPTPEGGVALFWRDISERLALLAAAEAARAEAEARAATLLAVIDSIPDAVLVGRADAVTLANRAALQQLGVPSVEALQAAPAAGLSLEDVLLDPETGAVVPLADTPIGRALAGERSHAHYLLRVRGAEATRPVRTAAAPITGPDGTILGAVAVLTDMTRVRAAEADRERLIAEVEVERARLAYVFQQAPAFLAVSHGPTHVFHLANTAYQRLVGQRDLIGRPVLDALPELRDQGFVAILDRVLATGEPFVAHDMPIVLARAGDAPPEQRFLDLVYLPLVEADGTRSGVIAHGTDVTAHVEARHEIERLLGESERARDEAEDARLDAEAANRTKAEFLAVMSHELRTPLNAIGGYVALMEMELRGPVTPLQRHDLARIQKSQQHLLGLINGVLNYARIEGGYVQYDLADVAVDEIAATAEALTAPQALAKGITLRFDGCDGSVRARADRDKMQQVVLNILSNAVKFTEPGGAVSLSCDVADAQVLVRVVDTGCGIPADALERVFQPFVQVDARLTRTHEGTGLGLAISRDLARGMGGDLTVESTSGVGSTFTLVLPLA